ncbi:conjugal transfer protein [Bartonella sp. CB189]|uniref:conjugal transfer protein n=1 Tax=Bartonella sp. CB189 TaxID=3112254 RepID=UPI002F96B64D
MVTSIIVKFKNMKYLDTFLVKVNRQASVIFMATIMFLTTQSANVHAETIVQAAVDADTLTNLYYGLSLLVPLIAAILFLFLLIIYVLRIIARTTFVRWSFSVLIAGAAFYISNILFHIN